MCVLLETRIGIGRQHLAVRVYADACTLGLLEQELKVMEVVPSHDDKGTLLDGERDLSGLRGTVGSRVCLIEHRHDRIVDLTYLEHERQQRINAARFAEGSERVYEELLHSLVRATKHAGMEGIGGHAPQAKEDERLERTNILVICPDGTKQQIVCSGHACGRSKALLLGTNLLDEGPDGQLIEVNVSDTGKQAVNDELIGTLAAPASGLAGTGQTHEGTRQLILVNRHLKRLATYAGIACATNAFGSLLALKTKHLLIHGLSSPVDATSGQPCREAFVPPLSMTHRP